MRLTGSLGATDVSDTLCMPPPPLLLPALSQGSLRMRQPRQSPAGEVRGEAGAGRAACFWVGGAAARTPASAPAPPPATQWPNSGAGRVRARCTCSLQLRHWPCSTVATGWPAQPGLPASCKPPAIHSHAQSSRLRAHACAHAPAAHPACLRLGPAPSPVPRPLSPGPGPGPGFGPGGRRPVSRGCSGGADESAAHPLHEPGRAEGVAAGGAGAV